MVCQRSQNIAKNMKKETKYEVIVLLILIVLALLIRIFIFQTQKVIETDGPYYAEIGKNLISGNGYIDIEGNLNLLLTPLYPILIGLLSFIIKNLELSARLISIVFGSLLIIPVYLIAKKFYGKKIGYLGALFIALYPPLVYISTITYTDSLYLFLLFTSLYIGWLALTENKMKLYLVLGLMLGLTYLTRPEGVFYVIFFSVLIILKFIKTLKINIKKIFFSILLLLFGFLIISSPFILFLHNNTGKWSLSEKTDVVFEFREKELYSLEYEEANFGLSEDGKSLKLSPYDTTVKKSMLSVILSDPNSVIKRYAKNIYIENSRIIPSLFPFIFIIIIAIGIFGSSWDKENYKKELFLIILSLYPLLLYPLFWVEERYLLPITPIFIIWLAKGSMELSNWAKKTLNNLAIKINNKIIPILVVSLILIAFLIGNLIITSSLDKKYEKSDQAIEHKEAGLWLKENSENPIVMSRKPWVSFYSGGKFVLMPYADYKNIINYAKLKKAEYIVIDERYIPALRPQLTFLINEENTEDLELIYKNTNYKYKVLIYKLK